MFCFCWKFFSTVLPFLENNIHKLLNICQMIQICQGFQPNFKSFMKSLIGYISNNLADENVTGEDFSHFLHMTFRSQASVCVHMKLIPCNPECPWSVQKQLLPTDKYTKKCLFSGNIYFQWRVHVFWLQLQTYFPSLHLLISQLSALLTKYLPKINFNLVFLH